MSLPPGHRSQRLANTNFARATLPGLEVTIHASGTITFIY